MGNQKTQDPSTTSASTITPLHRNTQQINDIIKVAVKLPQTKNMPKTTIPFALTVLAVTTLPLFFLNLTPNPFETNKALFITVIDLLLFIILILQAAKHKAIVFRSSPIHLPLTLFLTSPLVSLIVASPSQPLSVATELFPLLIVA